MTQLSFSVRGDVNEVKRHLRAVERKMVPQVVASSLNTTARTIRTRGLRRASAQLQVSTRVLGKRARLQRASFRNWEARLFINRKPINLAREARARQTRAGVNAGRKNYPGAFIIGVRGGPVIVERVTTNRTPLKTHKVDVSQQLSTFDRLTKRTAAGIFRRTFAKRLSQRLKRQGAGVALSLRPTS